MNQTALAGKVRPVRIAYQGEPGAFSEEAALQLELGAITVPCCTLPKLFTSVSEGRADSILVPVENTLAGSLGEAYDLMSSNEFSITSEVIMPIHHQLIGLPGSSLSDIRVIRSHPVALAQCTRYFAENPDIMPQASEDTAGSVRQLFEWNAKGVAAIASERAAHKYGGIILARNIEDEPHNMTRFLLMSRNGTGTPGGKVSFLVRLHRPQNLASVLRLLEEWDLVLLNVVTRPVKSTPWQYFYFIDVGGVLPDARETLRRLGEFASDVRILGQYQAAAGCEPLTTRDQTACP